MPVQDRLPPFSAAVEANAVANATDWVDIWFRYKETDSSGSPMFAQSGNPNLTGVGGILGYNDSGQRFNVDYAPETNIDAASTQLLPDIGTNDFIVFIHGIPSAGTDTSFVLGFGDTAGGNEKYIWFQQNTGAGTANLYLGDSITIAGAVVAAGAETMVVIARRGNVAELYKGHAGAPVKLVGTVDCTGFDMTGANEAMIMHAGATNDRNTYQWGMATYPNSGCPSQAAIGSWFSYMAKAALAGYKLAPPAMVGYSR